MAIVLHETAGTTDAQEYQDAVMDYYRLYLTRAETWSPHLEATFDNFNLQIYNLMWGPSEFTASGTLRDYNREDVLPDLQVPVLFTAGRFDEATPETLAHFHSLVPKSEIAIFEYSAHMTMLDEPKAYADAIRQFINKVDP
jgi:proline iminopeptidase